MPPIANHIHYRGGQMVQGLSLVVNVVNECEERNTQLQTDGFFCQTGKETVRDPLLMCEYGYYTVQYQMLH